MTKKLFLLIIALSLLVIIFFASCDHQDDSRRIKTGVIEFSELLSSQTNIGFSNTIEDKLSENIGLYDYFYNGAGVAIGDIDNDGLSDIFFTGNQVPNKLYKNLGDFKYKDISKEAGIEDAVYWSTGVTMVDINQDGWLDIYVCHAGPMRVYSNRQNHLYINNQHGAFTESSIEYGLEDNSLSSQAAFFDYDIDGDLDLFVMNHTDFINRFRSVSSFLNRQGAIEQHLQEDENLANSANILFENIGDNTFEKVTKKANLQKWGFGLGLKVNDLNMDGFPDIYVANDYYLPDFVYYNNGDKTFTEVNKSMLGHNSQYSMGCDAADINNDGLPDISIVDMTANDRVRNKTLMRPMNESRFKDITKTLGYQKQYMFNVFQLNNGNGHFSEIGQVLNNTQTDWSWSTLLVDLNLDGLKDNFITNGYKRDTKNRDIVKSIKDETIANGGSNILENLKKYPSIPLSNYMFRNEGDLKFSDVSHTWGLDQPSFSNGAAYGDLDNDGDLDLVINNIDQEAFVYRNNTIERGETNYLKLDLGYDANNYNAKIEVYVRDTYQYFEFHPVRGYFSTMDPIIIVGLAKNNAIDSLIVRRLNGEVSKSYNLLVNQDLDVSKMSFTKEETPVYTPQLLFTVVDETDFNITKGHKENPFWDFKTEVLLPHKQSTNGPNISIGDIDGDRLDDFVIGGSRGYNGRTYIQTPQGVFKELPNGYRAYEDMGSLLFDYDNDGDLDLYQVSGGGGDVKNHPRLLQDRLYENNGLGQFEYREDALSLIRASGSSVKSHDYDNDGDPDLFVGGRVVPGKYPMSPRSLLLNNENGTFRDVTTQVAPDLSEIGMVTDFQWVDINADGAIDLIVLGEWMNIEVFEQVNGRFEKATSKYFEGSHRGWWFSLAAKDMDGDGDIDLIAGNLGLNNKFHASPKKPLEIFFNDFDDNGSYDIVLAKTDDQGNNYAVRGKDCSTSQMPFIKDKYPKYEDFATASLDEVYTKEKLDQSLHYSISDFSSAYFENVDGNFIRHQLPIQAQFAPIQDILIDDFDGDGLLDAVVAGNLFDTEIETTSYDAGTGVFLKGDGKGHFKALAVHESGLYLGKNLKDMAIIKIGDKRYIIGANNDDHVDLIRIND